MFCEFPFGVYLVSACFVQKRKIFFYAMSKFPYENFLKEYYKKSVATDNSLAVSHNLSEANQSALDECINKLQIYCNSNTEHQEAKEGLLEKTLKVKHILNRSKVLTQTYLQNETELTQLRTDFEEQCHKYEKLLSGIDADIKNMISSIDENMIENEMDELSKKMNDALSQTQMLNDKTAKLPNLSLHLREDIESLCSEMSEDISKWEKELEHLPDIMEENKRLEEHISRLQQSTINLS